MIFFFQLYILGHELMAWVKHEIIEIAIKGENFFLASLTIGLPVMIVRWQLHLC